jgi:hypothetical protein
MLLTLVLVTGTAHAGCDAKALTRALAESVPATVPANYLALAACDPAAARKLAPSRLKMMPANAEATKAAITAIEAGSGADVRTWLVDLVADERARMVKALAASGPEHPAVCDFFVAVEDALGERFWNERWYRGLAECRTPSVQAMLGEALDTSPISRSSRNRSPFFSLVEVYARNLGLAAIERLKGYLAAPKDEEESTVLLTAFGDAANVGGAAGTDATVAQAATAAILELAPSLSDRALARARDVLNGLGAEAEASGLARWAFDDAWTDAGYTYGVAAIEDVTCKNGQQRALLWLGTAASDGASWPDQISGGLDARVASGWPSDAAAKCKGTAKRTAKLSERPLVGSAGVEAWQAEVRRQFDADFAAATKREVATKGALP